MKPEVMWGVVLVVAIASFFVGSNDSSFAGEDAARLHFEKAVENYPRGGLDIPAQWFMMESLVGWEKMILIFGYADNVETCQHLLDIARIESPERNFRCENAN